MSGEQVEEDTSKEQRLEAARKKFEELKKKNKKKKDKKSKSKEATPASDEQHDEPSLEAKNSGEPSTEEMPLEEILSADTPAEESTFLTSNLQTQVATLTKQVTDYKGEVSKLKTENSELKLAKLSSDLELEDVKNDYETAKEKIKALTQQINKLRVDSIHQRSLSPQALQPYSDDDSNSLFSGSTAANAVNAVMNPASTNNTSTDYSNASDTRERLAHWKGWNVDMRDWRSVGTGPLLEL
ncbi:DEKNAAC102480 [Brettanomyces naardenensis]|uniref:DEKNAAC102480 n=1 Tax=Brettanomyces naardenensis TaxID=13370 RepID=A0A448YKQ4_BRENA|nr:DEKNAAC102480 [Brettanomyces naardenensis]